MKLLPDYKKLLKKIEKRPEIREEVKEKVYSFFQKHLDQRDLVIAKTGPNSDDERKPIDAVVIHHTSLPPGVSWQRLDAIQILTIYAAYYASPTDAEKEMRGQAIWSGHFRDGRQIFYTYHWLVRMDGTVEKLLPDDKIGWQAGNWDINTRSVGICLDGDFEDSAPPDAVLDAVAKLIKENYPQVKQERIFGHREINPKTTCPGNQFLVGWKGRLIKGKDIGTI